MVLRTAICGAAVPSRATEKLRDLGFETIILPPDGDLPSALSGHADLSVYVTGRTVICRGSVSEDPGVSGALEKTCLASGRVFLLSGRRNGKKYPDDAGLCCACSEGTVVCRTDVADPLVIREAERYGRTVVGVRQGYAACSTVMLRDGSAVTDDAGIAKALRKAGRDALCVARGYVSLPGYDSEEKKGGFIGGCCGVCGDTVYFIGDPESHPDYAAIAGFLGRHGAAAAALCGGGLFDAGKILFL